MMEELVTAKKRLVTDLHVVDGELPESKLPLIPGHEIVGKVLWCGSGRFSVGQRLGIPWLGWTCGRCRFCERGEENLCVVMSLCKIFMSTRMAFDRDFTPTRTKARGL
jgi:threonine dehydrogenase-like Zn-dependent dehydrogenase